MASTHKKPVVYIASYYRPKIAECIRAALPDVDVVEIPIITKGKCEKSDIDRLAEEAEVLITDSDSQLLQCLQDFKKLRWVQTASAGVQLMIQTTVKNKVRPSFLFTRTPAGGQLIGEYAVTYILALERRVIGMFQAQIQKNWRQQDFKHARSLSSLTVGVLGFGEMGKEVGRRCKQFGMTVWGLTRTPRTERCQDMDVNRTMEGLPELLENCDYVCSALPSTNHTAGLLSGGVLRHCQRKKTVLISVGRGDVVDEKSIVEAIENQWLGGAVLDVCPEEPLPADSRLWTLPNVLITPHVSGYSQSEENIEEFATMFVNNYRRFCNGQPLQHVVNFESGY